MGTFHIPKTNLIVRKCLKSFINKMGRHKHKKHVEHIQATSTEAPISDIPWGQHNMYLMFVSVMVVVLVTMVLREVAAHAKADTRVHERSPPPPQDFFHAIKIFPVDPHEYNERRFWKEDDDDQENWMKYNMPNGIMFAISTIVTFFLAYWHRGRRAKAEKKKTVVFWVWTVAASIVALGWSAYIFKVKERKSMAHQITWDPLTRFYFVMGVCAFGSMIAIAVNLKDIQMSKRQKAAEEWRERRQASSVRDLNYTMVHMMKSRKPPQRQ